MHAIVDPQDATRTSFKLKRKRTDLIFKIWCPALVHPLLEKTARELIPTLPPLLKRIIKGWLERLQKTELEHLKNRYTFNF